MSARTVNISFQTDLIEQIDTVAKEESRSRSEIIREAARMYIERKKRWKTLFAFGEQLQSRRNIREEDVFSEIKAVRSKD